MKELCYYVARSPKIDNTLLFIAEVFGCTIAIKSVEMDYREVTIFCEEGDVIGIQTMIASII